MSWSRIAARRWGVGSALEGGWGIAAGGYLASAVNPFLLPPRLALRVLDDLHAIAEAARRLPTIEATLVERFARLEERADGIEGQLGQVLGLGQRIERRGGELVALGERMNGRADDVLVMGDRLHATGEHLLARGEEIAARAAEVAVAAADLAAAFPTIERTAQIGETLAQAVEPLQGAAERLGRIVDRLPGGTRPRARGG